MNHWLPYIGIRLGIFAAALVALVLIGVDWGWSAVFATLIALAVSMHITTVLQRGGLPLVRSMASLQLRSGDLPGHWFDQIRRSLKVGR